MTQPRDDTEHRGTEATAPSSLRRRFLALVGGAGTALLAGCSTQTGSTGSGGSGGGGSSGGGSSAGPSTGGAAGTFRLLISDQPVAIDDFDSLEVTFDRARVFGGEPTSAPETPEETETPETDTPETETPEETETPATDTPETETPEETETPATDTPEDDDEEEGAGFTELDLDGATVDLTQVVGDKAVPVFEGELSAGRYTKIELYAADVAGVVDGDTVEVKIPSGKLMITKPFEVVEGETLSFVFDINVVQRGPGGRYNLLPVISESGVAGREVEVEEIGGEGGRPAGNESDDDAAPEDGGPPDEAGPPADRGGDRGNASSSGA